MPLQDQQNKHRAGHTLSSELFPAKPPFWPPCFPEPEHSEVTHFPYGIWLWASGIGRLDPEDLLIGACADASCCVVCLHSMAKSYKREENHKIVTIVVEPGVTVAGVNQNVKSAK